MDDATLARLHHANMIEAGAIAAGQGRGSHIARSEGVALIATTIPLRLFNQVLVEGDPDDAAIRGAVDVMRRRDARFVVNLRHAMDDRYVPLMTELGLVPMSDSPWMPGMAVHPLPDAAGLVPEGHEIRRVADARGVADHVATAAAGFEMPAEWVAQIVSEGLANHPAAALYVGYSDGQPVTTGLGIRTGRTIGVYNIATIEAARRRGYGAAMTMRILADGAAAGCDVAILQASDMGQPIYERLGFRTVVEYDGWVDPASLA